jgi:low temperature requirement protein LtrA
MSLLRDRGSNARVSNVELFFDLVYVVAVTQLTAFVRHSPTWFGALEALVLFGLVWNAWVYTTWVTNWLDPDRLPNRIMLFGVMLASLVMTAGITGAFGIKGLWVAIAYAAIQVGRSAYTVWATRGSALNANYQRILVWCSVSSALALAGGFANPTLRLVLFAACVVVDIIGGAVQFWVPGLGRSETQEWTIDGAHFAERCQAFLLIALGESVVGIGAALIDARNLNAVAIIGFCGAFIGVVVLFLLYFHHWAEIGVEAIIGTKDPGRLGRVFHFIHPVMIAGIILIAAGDEVVLAPLVAPESNHPATAAVAWFCAGGSAVFVIGHLIYIRFVAQRLSVPHLVVAAALLALGVFGASVPALTIGLICGALLIVLFAWDYSRLRATAALGG